MALRMTGSKHRMTSARRLGTPPTWHRAIRRAALAGRPARTVRATGRLRRAARHRHRDGRARRQAGRHRGAYRVRGGGRRARRRGQADRRGAARLIGWLTVIGFSRPPYADLRLTGFVAERAAVTLAAAALLAAGAARRSAGARQEGH